MALVTTKRNVDVLPGQAAPTVFHCSQHDVGATIILGLVNAGGNFSIPSGVTAIIQGSCSNGAVFTPVTATVSGSDITFNLSAEMTSIAGPTVCEAVLSKDTDVLGTANFILDVEPSAMGSDTPPVFTDAAWLWMVDKMGTETISTLGDKTVIDAIESKLDKNQGTANAGKYLKVDTDGNVETADLDVTTDKTLSIADKAADAKAVGDELTDLKADLSNITPLDTTLSVSGKAADAKTVGDRFAEFLTMTPVSITNGYYYPLNGTVVGDKTVEPEANYNACAEAECVEGDKFKINAYGMDITRAWAFADNNGNILAVANKNLLCQDLVVTAPQNATHFYSNCVPGRPKVFPLDLYSVSKLDKSIVEDVKKNSADIEDLSDTVSTIYDDLYGDAVLATPDDLINGYVSFSDGAFHSSTSWKTTDYVNIGVSNELHVNIASIYSTSTDVGLAFYDADKNNIDGAGVQCPYDPSSSAQSIGDSQNITVSVPNNAVYVRTSVRTSQANEFILRGKQKKDSGNDIQLPTPVLFQSNDLTQPSATGIDNKITIESCIDAETISICMAVTLTNSDSVVFLGSVDVLGAQHASHVQFDFSTNEMRIYAKGNGNSVPSSIIHTEDFSSLGSLSKVNLKIGRKDRELYAGIENYVTGNEVTYVVDEAELNNYKYPAGWLADKLTYGIINGSVSFDALIMTTKVSPLVAFLGDSITEGYGIPYEKSWPYQVGVIIGDYLLMGRSGGTYATVNMQINDIISKIKPKFTVVEIGTNGGNTETRISNICEAIKKCGSIPILCRIPMTSDASNTATINQTIAAQREQTVGFDYATSVNNELLAQDTSKFQSDKLHPNIDGATAMANRFLTDASFLKNIY